MKTQAVCINGPEDLELARLALRDPEPGEIVVEVSHSGISTGTEKLLWSGRMPPFPGMGYPLVPGYEAVGRVVEAAPDSGLAAGETVFVPGANCYRDARGLFGGSARHLITRPDRVARTGAADGAEGCLLALAATARHALAGLDTRMPDLIVGHGVLGRLLARLVLAAGAPAPTVWEIDPARRAGALDYPVIAPEEDEKRDYRCIFDASGHGAGLDGLITRLAKGGEIVLAGFYSEPLSFAFPPAFLREARIRVAAEWARDDLAAVRALVDSGALDLGGLITHRATAADAPAAYRTAFEDPGCLKMVLDWETVS